MESINHRHPLSAAICLLAVALIPVFPQDPILCALSLAGGILLYALRQRPGDGRLHLWCAVIFLVTAAITPLFNHRGVTVLFVMNDQPITLEATLCGLYNAALIVSALYWFGSFTKIMTEDKILCLFGKISPKFALILSMSLRFIPLFAKKGRQIAGSQRAMGLYREDNALKNIKSRGRVFSILLTWGLENGIITADSMEARGYGSGRRTAFARFRFRPADALLIVGTLAAIGVVALSALYGQLGASFYPALTREYGSFTLPACICYGILAFLPALLELSEEVKWKYLQSKI